MSGDEKAVKKVNRKICFVPDCTSSLSKNTELSFHNFPKKKSSYVEVENHFGEKEKVDRHVVWCKKLGVNSGSNLDGYVVCSRHFTKESFTHPSGLFLKRVISKQKLFK